MDSINEIFENGKLFDGRYKLIKLLSTSGGSADVWLALDMNTVEEPADESKATKVVIKIYRPKNFIDVEGEYQFRKEFKKVFGCHHENIIKPTYFSIFQEKPYLVLPYCPAGSSESMVGHLTDKDGLWKYIFEVTSGLAYLHEHTPQIIHQDIKPANVLIDDNGNYAITDFGISAEMGGVDAELEDETGGTFAYMAPERFIDGAVPMPESDIWALGATLFELVTGDAPFGNFGGRVQHSNADIPPISQDIPGSVKQLISSCLSFDPSERPTARQIVDNILRKRYARSKRTIALVISAVGLVAACIILYFIRQNSTQMENHLNSLSASADSIVTAQVKIISGNDGNPTLDNIPELKKAIVLFDKVIKEAPEDFDGKKMVVNKIDAINNLIDKIEDFDFTYRLVEGARITEMEDSMIKYSIVLDEQKISINQLLQQLK